MLPRIDGRFEQAHNAQGYRENLAMAGS